MSGKIIIITGFRGYGKTHFIKTKILPNLKPEEYYLVDMYNEYSEDAAKEKTTHFYNCVENQVEIAEIIKAKAEKEKFLFVEDLGIFNKATVKDIFLHLEKIKRSKEFKVIFTIQSIQTLKLVHEFADVVINLGGPDGYLYPVIHWATHNLPFYKNPSLYYYLADPLDNLREIIQIQNLILNG